MKITSMGRTIAFVQNDPETGDELVGESLVFGAGLVIERGGASYTLWIDDAGQLTVRVFGGNRLEGVAIRLRERSEFVVAPEWWTPPQ